MALSLPWRRRAADDATPTDDRQDDWTRHVRALREAGISEPGAAVAHERPATAADEQALYDVAPSFVALPPMPARHCVTPDWPAASSSHPTPRVSRSNGWNRPPGSSARPC